MAYKLVIIRFIIVYELGLSSWNVLNLLAHYLANVCNDDL